MILALFLLFQPVTSQYNWNLPPVLRKGATELFYEEVVNNSDVYNKIYPPFDYGERVTVTMASVFVSLLKVEENRQVVSYIARLNMTWRDFRLTFDPRIYGTYAIQLPPNSVWQPPVELFNCLDNKEQHRQRDETPVEIRADGHVSLLWYSQIETICVVDVAAFPFDEQWCNLGFSPGLATMDQLIIKTTNTVFSKMGIPEWQLLDVSTFESYFTQFGRNYSLAEIMFHLKRNPQFYIYFVILPTFVVTATCISAMLLPLDMNVGERINLGIAGLISLTFMLSVIVGELPRTPELPLMGKWVIVEMIFCCIGMIVPMILGVLDRFSFKPGKKTLNGDILVGHHKSVEAVERVPTGLDPLGELERFILVLLIFGPAEGCIRTFTPDFDEVVLTTTPVATTAEETTTTTEQPTTTTTTVTTTTTTTDRVCPMAWTKFMQNCYIFVATQVTWQAAEDDCVAQGAHLVSIHSQAEQDFVAALSPDLFWTGVHNVGGGYVWSDGTPLDFTKWNTGEPVDATKCGMYRSDAFDPTRQWNTAACTATSEYVCKS